MKKMLLFWVGQFAPILTRHCAAAGGTAARNLRGLVSRGFPLLALLTLPLLAQPGPVSIRPDCFEFFTFTATGNSNVFDNRSAGCPYFAIAYSSNGFTVESLVVQAAPDAGGTPGTWATYTANSGVNPNTAITQAFSTFSGYFPWLRVQLTSVSGSGSISGILYGWRTPPAIIAGGGTTACPGTVGTPCVVQGPAADGAAAAGNPVLVAALNGSGNANTLRTGSAQADGVNGGNNLAIVPYAWNGATWDRQFACTNNKTVTLTDGTLTALVAVSGSTVVRVCHVHASSSGGAETISLIQGTGVACAAAPVTIDSYLGVTAFATDYGPTGALRTAASNGLCVQQSGGAQSTVVFISYAQF